MEEIEDLYEQEKMKVNRLMEKNDQMAAQNLTLNQLTEEQKLQFENNQKTIKILETKMLRYHQDVSQWETELSDLKTANNELQGTIDSQQRLIRQLSSERDELEKKLKELSEYDMTKEEILMKYEASVEQLQDALVQQKKTIEGLESKLKNEQSDVASLREKIKWHMAQMEHEIEQRKQMESQYKEEVSKLLSEKALLTHECTTLSELNEQLQNELKETMNNTDQTVFIQQQLKTENNTLQANLQLHAQMIEELKMKNENYRVQYDALKLQWEQSQSDLNEQQVKYSEQLKKQQILEGELENEKDENKRWVNEHSKWNEERAELMRQLEESGVQREDMKQQMDEWKRKSEEKDNANKEDRLLQETQTHFKSTLNKLIKLEEAVEPNMACMSCMNMLNRPILCVPCGHAYCHDCFHELELSHPSNRCLECSQPVAQSIPNCPMLENIIQKHKYRKQVLETIYRQVQQQQQQQQQPQEEIINDEQPS